VFDSILYLAYTTVVSGTSTLPHDNCENAIAININVWERDDNVGADHEPKCGTTDDYVNGVFYSVVGNGNIMTATTCSPTTQFPSSVDIFSTACYESEGKQCIADENPGFTPECGYANGDSVTFDSKEEETYYIMVGGRTTSNQGVFDLIVKDYTAPDNDQCKNAQKLIVTNVDEPRQPAQCDLQYATKDEVCTKKRDRRSFCLVLTPIIGD